MKAVRPARPLAAWLLALAACSGGKDAPPSPPATPPAAPVAGAPTAPAAPAATPASGAASGSDDVATCAALATAAHKGKFPDADAYVALDRDDVTLRADGSVAVHHKSIVKILDAQRGKAKFADVHVPFDSARETLELAIARTVNADGVPHAASPDEVTDIVPPRLADATIYADARERVISFPAVDTGSVVELEYTRVTKAGADAPGGGELPLAAWNPIGSRVVTITVPAGAPAPALAVLGTTLAPTEATTAAGHTYTYSVADLPDRHAETGAAPDPTTLPRVLYGFQHDWKAALAPMAERFLAAAVPATPDPAIQAQADALVAAIPATDAAGRAAALYAFVAHEVRTIDLPLGEAGYQPHAPATVLANRYGDARDKTALLLALAAAEGISGTPVLARRGHVHVEASVPTLAQFDHIVAKLAIAGGETWVDPTVTGGRYGVALVGQDNLVLPVVRGGSELGARPVLPPDSSTSHTTAKLALAADGTLDAQYSYDLTGWFASEAVDTLRPLAGEHLVRYFQRAAGELAAGATDSGHEVGDLTTVTGALHIAQHVTAPGYAQAQGTVRVLELPAMAFTGAEASPHTGLTTRTTPLYVGTPTTESADVTLEIPAGWKVTYVPPEQTGSADGVSYRERCSADGRTVTCHREVTLSTIEIAAAQYPAFRDAFAKLHAYERRIVVLAKA